MKDFLLRKGVFEILGYCIGLSGSDIVIVFGYWLLGFLTYWASLVCVGVVRRA
jgi:hypothetical protein